MSMAANMMRIKEFVTLVAANALGVDRRTVSDYLDTCDSKGRDDLANDLRLAYLLCRVTSQRR